MPHLGSGSPAGALGSIQRTISSTGFCVGSGLAKSGTSEHLGAKTEARGTGEVAHSLFTLFTRRCEAPQRDQKPISISNDDPLISTWV